MARDSNFQTTRTHKKTCTRIIPPIHGLHPFRASVASLHCSNLFQTNLPNHHVLWPEARIFKQPKPIKKPAQGRLFYGFGAPGRIRTSDPLVRSQVLYPTELRARIYHNLLEQFYFSSPSNAAHCRYSSWRSRFLLRAADAGARPPVSPAQRGKDTLSVFSFFRFAQLSYGRVFITIYSNSFISLPQAMLRIAGTRPGAPASCSVRRGRDYSVHPRTSSLRGQRRFAPPFKFVPDKFVEPYSRVPESCPYSQILKRLPCS